MKSILVHDRRIIGRTRPGNYAHFDVDATTPLSYFVLRTLQEAAAYHGEAQLTILAHGYEVPPLGGGFGVVFCREDLTLATIGMLAPLRGHLRGGIALLSCATAHIAPGMEGRHGDGNVLCSRLAQVTGTTVTAGTSDQYPAFLSPWNKHSKSIVDQGPWSGTVLTYAPSGAVQSVAEYPVHR